MPLKRSSQIRLTGIAPGAIQTSLLVFLSDQHWNEVLLPSPVGVESTMASSLRNEVFRAA